MVYRAGMFKPGLDHMGREQQIADMLYLRGNFVELSLQSTAVCSAPMTKATPPAAPGLCRTCCRREPAQIEKIAAHPAKIGGRGIKGHITAQCPEIAEMVGDALEFERRWFAPVWRLINCSPARDSRAWQQQRLWPMAVSPAMASQMIGILFWARSAGVFQPPDADNRAGSRDGEPLAAALESKMPRFYDAGMHRTHRHLMHCFAFHLEIRVPARDLLGVVVTEDIVFPL